MKKYLGIIFLLSSSLLLAQENFNNMGEIHSKILSNRGKEQFRKNIMKEGFIMMQYSVYVRTCPSKEFAERIEKRIKRIVPAKGNVRLISITEKQYQDMKILVGSRSLQEECLGTERMIVI